MQAAIINDLAERYPMIVVAQTLDRLKDAGFYWATRSGVTVAIGDVIIPPEKQEILDRLRGAGRAGREGIPARRLNHAERNDDLVKIWEAATEEIEEALPTALPGGQPDPS